MLHDIPQELAAEYSVDPELIFSFYRPLIRGIAPPAAAGADAAAGGGAADQQEEEGEIGEMSTSPAGGAKGGADAMEDGQLEAGEVAASGTLVPLPPPPAADAAQRWEELEAQVRIGGLVVGLEKQWWLRHVPARTRCLPMCRWAHPNLCPLQQVRAMHGASSEATPWRGLSPMLYTTFWALQLYDLEVPTAR